MATTRITCPECGVSGLDIRQYDSMMVLSEEMAMFTLRCPSCTQSVSSVRAIPPELREEVRFAAIELDAGMGRDA